MKMKYSNREVTVTSDVSKLQSEICNLQIENCTIYCGNYISNKLLHLVTTFTHENCQIWQFQMYTSIIKNIEKFI